MSSPAGGRNISWLLETRALVRGDHPFLIWEPFEGLRRTWTYGGFDADVRRLAAGLEAHGIRAGSRVLIHLNNCPEFLLTWFACARLGAVAVCSNVRLSPPELAYVTEHANVDCAVTEEAFLQTVASALGTDAWIFVCDIPADGATPSASERGHQTSFWALLNHGEVASGGGPEALAPAWLQYTSGTTSRPKAVVLTHANALWAAQTNASVEGLTIDDVHLVHLPLFHVNGLCLSILATMWAGCTAVLTPRFSASRFWDVALRNRCTWLSTIPFVTRALSTLPVPPNHAFRVWASSSADPEVDRKFKLRLIGWYAMTETQSPFMADDVSLPSRPRSVGRPTPHYTIQIRRDDGSLVRAHEPGALFVRGLPGISLFAEYLGDSTATTQAVDRNGWLDTGDIVALDDDGSVTFVSRRKDMLKVGGENVAASEIEAVVGELATVAEVAVVGAPHPMLDEVPVAFIIPAGEYDEGALIKAVLERCNAVLASFKVPREIRIVDQLPRATLAKVAKHELRALLADEVAHGT